MRIDPRQHLLGIWKATVAASWRDGIWHWGGRDGSNSISDAEQLLCILLPATRVGPFALDRPNTTADEMLAALAPLGNERTIPLRLVETATDYFTRYIDDTGRPRFAGGGYFSAEDGRTLTEAQQDRDIVDSFAISVTLSLATIGFVRILRQSLVRQDSRRKLDTLEQLASSRLTAAMVGMLRSFSTHVFDASDEPGKILIDALNKSGQPSKRVVSQFRTALREDIASFEEVLIGSGQTEDLASDNRLFECGWSWGIIEHAPEVVLDDLDHIGRQPDGVAENRPNLYFTVVAVDAMEDLFSERTRVLGLLNAEQQRLARALQLRWDLTVRYWATVATFGEGPVWPLEDPPWTTTDGLRNDYFTLLLTSLVVKDLARRRGSDTDLARIGVILLNLSNEARVTRQHRSGDSGIRLHMPGMQIPLGEGAGLDTPGENKAEPLWTVDEFAFLLLHRIVVIGSLITDVEQRARLLGLADGVWDHLSRRRLDHARSDHMLWDQPAQLFEDLPRYSEPSWHHTERVVRALVSTADLVSGEPLTNDRLVTRANDLLYEAEHLYDMELMRGTSGVSPEVRDVLTEVRIRLERARSIVFTRPGVAATLCASALMSLDRLDAVRDTDGTVF